MKGAGAETHRGKGEGGSVGNPHRQGNGVKGEEGLAWLASRDGCLVHRIGARVGLETPTSLALPSPGVWGMGGRGSPVPEHRKGA